MQIWTIGVQSPQTLFLLWITVVKRIRPTSLDGLLSIFHCGLIQMIFLIMQAVVTRKSCFLTWPYNSVDRITVF